MMEQQKLELIKKYESLLKKVYEKLKSSNHPKFESRYCHSIGVAKAAYELSVANGLTKKMCEKAFVAGIVHDYCKYEKIKKYIEVKEKYNLDIEINDDFKAIYHSILAPYIIKDELGIEDLDILEAVENHAMGKENMNVFMKIIYLSDYIEETRVGETYMKARKIAFTDLDKAVAYVSKSSLQYLINNGSYVYIQSLKTYNYYRRFDIQ